MVSVNGPSNGSLVERQLHHQTWDSLPIGTGKTILSDSGPDPYLVLVVDSVDEVVTNIEVDEVTFFTDLGPSGSDSVVGLHSGSVVDLVSVDHPGLVVLTH